MHKRHLTFANIASATALVVALGGGGFAVAASVAKNSVGSPQIKKGAVKSSDLAKKSVKSKHVANNTLSGKDLDESTLGEVPSVDKLAFPAAVTAALGQTVTLATKGPLTIRLECVDNAGTTEAELQVVTSVNGAAFDANLEGGDFDPLNVGDVGDIVAASGTEWNFEDGLFAALTPSGEMWAGYGNVQARPGTSTGCSGQLVLFG